MAASPKMGFHFTIGAFWVSKLDAGAAEEFMAMPRSLVVHEAKVRAPI